MTGVFLLGCLLVEVDGGGDITITAGGSMNVFAGESISITCGGGAGSGHRSMVPALPDPNDAPDPDAPAGGRRLQQQQSPPDGEGNTRDVSELISEMRERLAEMEIMLVEEREYQHRHPDSVDVELLEQMTASIVEVRQMVRVAETELQQAPLAGDVAARSSASAGAQEARLRLSIEQLVAKELQLKHQPDIERVDQRPRRRRLNGGNTEPATSASASDNPDRRTTHHNHRQWPRPPQPAPANPPSPPSAPSPSTDTGRGNVAEFVQTNEWNLISAATDGNLDAIKEAIANGAEIDSVAPGGIAPSKRTPLIAAVSRGRLGCARLLLHYGASLSVGGDSTPILAAASMLGASGIPAGLPKPARSRDAMISTSTTSAWTSLEMLLLLLNSSPAGSSAQGVVKWGDHRTVSGQTVLHLLAGAGTAAGSLSGRSWGPTGLRELRRVLLRLLSTEGDGQRTLHWEVRAAEGRTALMEAAISIQPALVTLFLALGANATVGDDAGETALHHAMTALTNEVSRLAIVPHQHRHLVLSGSAGAALHTVAILARYRGGIASGFDMSPSGQQTTVPLSPYEQVLLTDLEAVMGSAGSARVANLIVRRPRWTVYIEPAPHADMARGRLEEPKLFVCRLIDLNAERYSDTSHDTNGVGTAELNKARPGKQLHSVGRRMEQFEELHSQLVGVSAAAAARSRTHHSPVSRASFSDFCGSPNLHCDVLQKRTVLSTVGCKSCRLQSMPWI